MEKAKKYFLEGNFKEALRRLLEIKNGNVQNPEYFRLLGLTFGELNSYDEAKKNLRKAVEINPNDAESFIDLGIVNYKSGDLNSARKNFEKALSREPKNIEALINLAMLERNEGNYEAAIERFLEAEKLSRDNFLIKYNLAYCYSKIGYNENAKKKINEALKIKTDAQAFSLLGSILKDEKDFEQAKKVYEKAIELNASNYKIYTNYGIVLHYLGEFEKAKKSFLKALELNPDYYDTKLNLAATLYQLQDYATAEKIYEDLIIENPNDKILRLNYSVLLLKTGNFKRGLEEYENRLSDEQLSVLPSVPFWNGENLAGKTLLVLDEQGAGDAIQFVRYLKLLKNKAARIILQTKKELASLFMKNNLADEIITSLSDFGEADYKIYLLSLPKILGKFPYNAGKYLLTTQKITLPYDDLWKMKIGIVWRGNAENIYDKLRSIELNDFVRALDIPNAIFYSFQIDATADEKAVLKEKNIIDLSDKIGSFEDTANLLNEIDLLILVDTAIAHLAGAMGKKTFLIIGEQDWRWGINSENTEWYDSLKLFRKKPEENFNRVLITVKTEAESFSKKILNGKTLLLKLNAIEELNAGNVQKSEELLQLYNEKTNDFEGYYWLGYIYSKRKKYNEAKRFYLEANKRNPQHEPTLSGLGNIALLENNFDDAAKYYSAALKLKRDVETLNNFGYALYKLKKHKKAAEIFEEAIAIKKDPGFFVNAANNYFEMQEFDKALEYYNFAIQKGDLQGAHVGKGFLLLALGKFREGFREFVWSLDSVKVPQTLGKYWEGEDLREKTIVVYTEQGLGDAINFFRFLVPLKERGATVKVVCAKPLEKLFKTSPYVDEVKSEWFDEADYHISIMDLPRALGVEKEDDFAFPQDLFTLDEKIINRKKEKLDNKKLNVGLVWRTYSKAETAKERSISENEIKKLLNLDVNFYAMQIDMPPEIKNSLEKEFPNLTFINENFYELAHTIKAFDLIITIDTSVLHLAGSLGAKTFALIKKFPDWRWKFEGEKNYVYPSIKIFRQRRYYTWHEPIDEIIGELKNIMNHKNNYAFDYHRSKSEILDLSEKFISKGKLNVALEILEEGIYFYPENEEILFKAGYISQMLGDLEKAVFYYGRLLAKNQAHINALNNIGVALKDLRKFNEATKFLNLLIVTYPDFASAYNNLGLVYEELGEFRTAVQYYEKALKINPNFRDALLNKGNSLMFLYEFDDAINSVDKILLNNPNDIGANYNKGIIYLFKGDYENGFPYYEWRRKRPEYMRRSFSKPELNGYNISGKRILVYDEQGYGDSIQFCRFVKKLKELGAYVILQTHAGLQSLLSRCEGVDNAIVRDTLGDPKGVEYDYHIPLLSLPRFFGIKNVNDITNDSAYIKTNMNLKKKYRKEIFNGAKTKVGLVWEGKKPKGNEHRSASLEVYAEFIRKYDFDFYSLQQKNVAQKNKQLMNELGVVDLSDHLHNFDQTAAIIDNLDFVITIDTSIAHLSGALNKKTFVLLSRKADWRWTTEERTPWYSSHFLLRQKKLGDWSHVIENLIDKINSFETDFKLIN